MEGVPSSDLGISSKSPELNMPAWAAAESDGDKNTSVEGEKYPS